MRKKIVFLKENKKLFGFAISSLFLGLFVQLSWEFFEKDQLLHVIDISILKYFEMHRKIELNASAVDVTSMGSLTFTFFLSFVTLIVLYLRKNFLGLMYYTSVLVSAGLSIYIIKHVFRRVRPIEVSHVVEVSGYSYPSGHTLISTTIYLTLAFLSFKTFKNLGQRIVIFSVACFISGLIGLSRIYLGVHYPSDVLAGALFGASLAFFMATFFFHKYEQ